MKFTGYRVSSAAHSRNGSNPIASLPPNARATLASVPTVGFGLAPRSILASARCSTPEDRAASSSDSRLGIALPGPPQPGSCALDHPQRVQPCRAQLPERRELHAPEGHPRCWLHQRPSLCGNPRLVDQPVAAHCRRAGRTCGNHVGACRNRRTGKRSGVAADSRNVAGRSAGARGGNHVGTSRNRP